MKAIHIQNQYTQNGTLEYFRITGVNVVMQALVENPGANAHASIIFQGSNIPDEDTWVDIDTMLLDGSNRALDADTFETAYAFGRLVISNLTGKLFIGVSSADAFAGSGGSGGGGGGGQTDGLTNAELRAAAVDVTVTNAGDIGGGNGGPVTTDGLTDEQLRASAVAVTGPATNAQLRDTPLAVTGPATDAQLRATALAVSVAGVSTAANQVTQSNILTDMNGKVPALVGGAVPVVGPLTDAQLRANPIGVSFTWSGLTDAQLRATPIAVSLSDYATGTGQASIYNVLASIAGYTDGLEGLIGTTNTTLATITGYVDGLESLLNDVKTNTAGLPGKVDATNTALGTLQTTATNINANAAAIKTSTDAVKTSTDAATTAIGVTNTAIGTAADAVVGAGANGSLISQAKTQNYSLGDRSDTSATSDGGAFSLIALFKRLLANITLMSAKLPASLGAKTSANSLSVVLASDSAGVGGSSGPTTVTVAGSFTRPADTTAYTLGDLVSTSTTAASVVPITLAGMAKANGGTGMIRRLKLAKSSANLANASYRIHLYKSLPGVSAGDNAAFTANNVADYLGYVDLFLDVAFSTPGIGAAGVAACEILYRTGASVADLYALIEVRAAYTPTSGETFTLTADTLED